MTYPVSSIHDLSPDDYRAREEVSNSDLSQFARSPLHYAFSRDNPTPSTPAQQLGTAVHTLVLEEESFPLIYRTLPEDINLRTKIGREERDYLLGKVDSPDHLLNADTAKLVNDMAAAVRSHPVAREMLEGAVTEVSRFWEEPFGLRCKCRVDAMPVGQWSDTVVDIKTTVNADPYLDFPRSLARWGYHRQAAFYLKSFPEGRSRFHFIAVESKPPHGVSVMELDARSIAQGLLEVDELVSRFTQCQAEDKWPGYSDFAVPVSLPAYAFKSP